MSKFIFLERKLIEFGESLRINEQISSFISLDKAEGEEYPESIVSACVSVVIYHYHNIPYELLYKEVFRLANCYRNIFTKQCVINHIQFMVRKNILLLNEENKTYSIPNQIILNRMTNASMPYLGNGI